MHCVIVKKCISPQARMTAGVTVAARRTGGASVCSVVSGACSGLMDGHSLNLKGRKMCFLLFLYLCSPPSWSLAPFKEKMFGRKRYRRMRPYFSMELKHQ